MKKQLQGIAVILFSILLTMCFGYLGWDNIGDLSLCWSHLFMIIGAGGAVMVFLPDKKDNSNNQDNTKQ